MQPAQQAGNWLEQVDLDTGRDLERKGTAAFVEDELDLMASVRQSLAEGKRHFLDAAAVEIGQQQANASSRFRTDCTVPCGNPFG